MGASYTKMQTARTSVRQARATQLAQAAEREARIEKSATAAVLAWEARQKAAERLATADEHVSAQLQGLVVEKLSVSQIVTLTGIPQRNCRTTDPRPTPARAHRRRPPATSRREDEGPRRRGRRPDGRRESGRRVSMAAASRALRRAVVDDPRVVARYLATSC